MNIVAKAREFALNAHGDQNHGSLKIADHLWAVTDKIESQWKYAAVMPAGAYADDNLELLLSVGWLHDVLEDTDVNYVQLVKEFGPDIANCVSRVTDQEGIGRKGRHINTYYRIREDRNAIFVKLADRWHNQKRSIDLQERRFAKMYLSEYTYFKFALYSPSLLTDDFWQQLDEQQDGLEDVAGGFVLDKAQLVA